MTLLDEICQEAHDTCGPVSINGDLPLVWLQHVAREIAAECAKVNDAEAARLLAPKRTTIANRNTAAALKAAAEAMRGKFLA